MAGKKVKIKHNRLENCSNKMLASVDLLPVCADGVLQVIEKIADLPGCREYLKEYDYGVVLLLNADVVPTNTLDLYRVLGSCHKCESIISYSISPRFRLLDITLAYLIENGNFNGRSVRIPGEDEVIEALKRHEIYLEFSALCDQCGTHNSSLIAEDGAQLVGMKTPRLTV